MYYQRPKPVGRRLSIDERKKMNRQDKRGPVREDRSHAILVYSDEKPVGWCQYGTRAELPRIDAGRNYKKVESLAESERLWRITCFFVDKEHRGTGVARLALHEALTSIGRQDGGVVEAYPIFSKKMAALPEWRWFGTPSMFRRERSKPVANAR
jgi:GNAT superfamily N-acetyltransferase